MIRLYDRELNSSFIRFYRLRSAAAAVASSTKASSTLPSTKLPLAVGQSVSLDMLFASPSTSASSPSIRAASSPLHQSAPTNPLDLLFLNAAAKSSPQQQPRQPPPPTIQSSSQPTIPSSSATPASAIPKTLEQLFAAASPVPQSATLPFQALSQAHLSAPSPSLLPNSLPQGNKSREGPSAARSKEEHRGMSLLDSIFASAQTNGSHSVSVTSISSLLAQSLCSRGTYRILLGSRYRNLSFQRRLRSLLLRQLPRNRFVQPQQSRLHRPPPLLRLPTLVRCWQCWVIQLVSKHRLRLLLLQRNLKRAKSSRNLDSQHLY